jgi:Ca-activated chloride channel family protein
MAKVFIEQLHASGGTNMQSALHAALVGQRTVHPNQKQGLRQIVFISDASISNEEQLLTQIKQQLGDSRLFMVGIGSAPNRYFMRASSKIGKGSYTNIADVNEVQRKMSTLFTQLANPVLRDIQLQWADGTEVDYWPKPVRDLYQGEPLQLLFKIPKMKKALHISGLRFAENNVKQWSQDVALQQQHNAQGVDILWAKAQIDSLELNRELSDIEKKKEIIALGSAFHIVTKHTSLLAVEQKLSRPIPLDSINMQVKTHLPQGNMMRLPQTGQASELYKQIGFVLLLLAAVLWVLLLTFPQLKNNGLEGR